ncbi:hypothetical protein CK203_004324 [Vitis vinifera]|uniref:Uncharacterized protein n=1 Tax=Vitis vinifera TaxID=29760 RepID=A0A438K9Z9_VITVI|nr:hypothetical protein CK203_004324 [Vitis vinifera]
MILPLFALSTPAPLNGSQARQRRWWTGVLPPGTKEVSISQLLHMGLLRLIQFRLISDPPPSLLFFKVIWRVGCRAVLMGCGGVGWAGVVRVGSAYRQCKPVIGVLGHSKIRKGTSPNE